MKYKVLVIEVLGKGNNIFKGGDIVSDANFPEGNAEKLTEEGKLELYIEDVLEREAVKSKGAKRLPAPTDENLPAVK